MKKITVTALGTLAVFAGMANVRAQENPNIVFILADDLGYGDVSCLNEKGKIPTPNIDRIAKEGVTFTDAHSSSSVCTPTRYGILTGRYNWRSTLKEGVLGGYSKALIPEDRTTMASMLKDEGYHTGCIGKWHLGWSWAGTDKGIDSIDYSQPISHGPITVGFDYFYGIPASLDMVPYVYVENDRITSVPDRETKGDNRKIGDPEYNGRFWRKGLTGGDFVHEDCLPNLTRRAVDFIVTHAKKSSPYFLYFPMPAPHTPILPSKEFQGKSGLNAYADYVMMVDAEVGKVLDAIEQNGEKENTIVVFASDNGCAPAADLETLEGKGHYPSYIYRGYKADLFDGGHRIPCMVRWPSKLKPHRIEETICLTDFMATFASVTGYRLKDNEGEDSFNLMPLLEDHAREYKREATVNHSINGSFTIRKGKWKLLFSPGSGGWSYPRPGKDDDVIATLPPYQLYDLESDPGETHNLYQEQPEVVKELKALMMKYIKEGRSTPGKPQKNDGKETSLEYWKTHN
jgi:arylsulfatase A-like enzyme